MYSIRETFVFQTEILYTFSIFIRLFVEYMYRALCVHNFFIYPRPFINSSDSIERKVLEEFLGLIRRLSLPHDKIEQLRRCMKLCSLPFLHGFQSFALPFRTLSNSWGGQVVIF